MNLTEALSGSAGLEGIRWMLTGAPHRALRRELASLLATPGMLGPCYLRLARFRPARRLTAFYDVHIRIEGNGKHYVRPIAVAWRLDADEDETAAALVEMNDEAEHRGVSAPFRQLVADAPELKMHIEVSPLDVHYPQAVRVCDPKYVSKMIASAVASDRAPASRYSVTSVRYRPGKRHILRYDPLDAPERGAIFVKLYTGEKGVQAFGIAEQIGQWLAEHGAGAISVRPLAYVAEDAVVLYPQAPGLQLSRRLQHPSESLARALKDVGAVLHALHQLPETVTGPLEIHDFVPKVKEKHISAFLPSADAAVDALLERAQDLLEHLPSEAPTFTYGDFKAEHVWASPGGLTLIDFDSCRRGDPALDIGKFLADLQFWCIAYGRHELNQAQEQFLAGYGPDVSPERMMRARLYEPIELVKLASRRVGLLDRNWAGRTKQLIGCAQAVLSDLQRDLMVPREVKKRAKHAHR